MKLSALYTEAQLLEVNAFKKLIGVAGKAFGRAKRDPNVRNLEVRRVIDEVFENIWAEYYDNPKVQGKLEAYRTGSLSQHIPELAKIRDPVELRRAVWELLKDRAEYYKSRHESFKVDPSWAYGRI